MNKEKEMKSDSVNLMAFIQFYVTEKKELLTSFPFMFIHKKKKEKNVSCVRSIFDQMNCYVSEIRYK